MNRSKLIAARNRKHLTQTQVATRIGIDVKTLSRWEQGTATPRAYNIEELTKLYGCPAFDLGLDEQPTNVAPIETIEGSNELKLFAEVDITMQLMMLAFLPGRSFQDVQNRMKQLIEEYDTMNQDNEQALMSRREALRRVAALPLISFGLSALQPVLTKPADDIIMQCAASVAACWELSKGDDESDLALAFRGASTYLPTLKAIVAESAKYRKQAASLAGQCELLRTLLGWHLQGLKEAQSYANEAVKYCTEAGDESMLLSTLDYQAWAYYYDSKPHQALQAIEKAIPILRNHKGVPLSPQLLGGIHCTLAIMRAKNGISGTKDLLDAEGLFAVPQSGDQRLVYMDYTQGDLMLNTGFILYYQHQYKEAKAAFNSLIDPNSLKTRIVLPERSRIEGLNFMLLTTLKSPQKDLEWILYIWDTAMIHAKQLQSEQRYSEASIAYEIIEAVWSGEKRVEERRELASHW